MLMLHADARREFSLELPEPHTLGADRLANVAGALRAFAPPFLILDAGTATTFCLVDRDRRYIGGAIVPGFETSFRALTSKAARLFSVELKRPKSVVGTTTETQLTSGMIHGYEALIEGLTDRLVRDAQSASSGHFENPTLIATGGCLRSLNLSSRFRLEKDLTLRGLLRYGELHFLEVSNPAKRMLDPNPPLLTGKSS
jgi:type III pantothenate kinase